jgi:hypothetical protein
MDSPDRIIWTTEGFHFSRKYSRELAQLFSPTTALTLSCGELGTRIPVLASRAATEVSSNRTVGEFLEAAYSYLNAGYRAEYIYKNTIARKILLGRHSIATTRMFTEFRVEQSKADVVLVNGTTTAYEIKTELDSLERLNVQLAAYCRVFDRVFVVTCESLASRAAEMAPQRVGILILTSRGSLRTERDAASNLGLLSLGSMFDTMRKTEYTRLIEDAFGSVPDVPNSLMHRECRNRFKSLGTSEAHRRFIHVLKERDRKYVQPELVRESPSSLAAMCLTTAMTEPQARTFIRTLHVPVLVSERRASSWIEPT